MSHEQPPKPDDNSKIDSPPTGAPANSPDKLRVDRAKEAEIVMRSRNQVLHGLPQTVDVQAGSGGSQDVVQTVFTPPKKEGHGEDHGHGHKEDGKIKKFFNTNLHRGLGLLFVIIQGFKNGYNMVTGGKTEKPHSTSGAKGGHH